MLQQFVTNLKPSWDILYFSSVEFITEVRKICLKHEWMCVRYKLSHILHTNSRYFLLLKAKSSEFCVCGRMESLHTIHTMFHPVLPAKYINQPDNTRDITPLSSWSTSKSRKLKVWLFVSKERSLNQNLLWYIHRCTNIMIIFPFDI